jgi:Bacterial regulatory proteins, tetR family.
LRLPDPRVGAKTSDRNNETRRRLVRAALTLFAERGPASVTIREVLQRARQRNQSAIQYHFGSKHNLLLAVVAEVHECVDPHFAGALEQLHQLELDQRLDARQVAHALVLPIIELFHSGPEGRNAIYVIAWLLTSRDEAVQRAIIADLSPFLSHIERHLARLLPHKRREKLQLQILLSLGSMLFGLLARGTLRHSPFSDRPLYRGQREASIQDALALVCDGLLGEEVAASTKPRRSSRARASSASDSNQALAEPSRKL